MSKGSRTYTKVSVQVLAFLALVPYEVELETFTALFKEDGALRKFRKIRKQLAHLLYAYSFLEEVQFPERLNGRNEFRKTLPHIQKALEHLSFTRTWSETDFEVLAVYSILKRQHERSVANNKVTFHFDVHALALLFLRKNGFPISELPFSISCLRRVDRQNLDSVCLHNDSSIKREIHSKIAERLLELEVRLSPNECLNKTSESSLIQSQEIESLQGENNTHSQTTTKVLRRRTIVYKQKPQLDWMSIALYFAIISIMLLIIKRDTFLVFAWFDVAIGCLIAGVYFVLIVPPLIWIDMERKNFLHRKFKDA